MIPETNPEGCRRTSLDEKETKDNPTQHEQQLQWHRIMETRADLKLSYQGGIEKCEVGQALNNQTLKCELEIWVFILMALGSH